jgi:membrane fusion protein (multidrug efflux system)
MALKDEQEKRDRTADLRGEHAPSGTQQRVLDAPSVAPEQPERKSAIRRHPYIAAAAAIVILAALAYGVVWWLNALNYVSTDDAFIDTRVVQISSQITGRIIAVPVTDNQNVDEGALLVRIDPRDYEAALEQAQAQLEQAKAAVANVQAQIAAQQSNIQSAQTNVTQAQAALTFSQQQFERAHRLLATGAGTQQQEQQTRSDLTQKQAALTASQAGLTAAQRQLRVLQTQKDSAQAQVDAAEAGLTTAQVNLNRTTISAPVASRVANLSAAIGNLAQPGTTLMTLVPRDVWVTANFKETDLGSIKIGDPVQITVDAYPGKTFQGRVASIQAGSGTAFSLLPAQNATGNFVKIVQRVPVKITFDSPPDVHLGPGMSVVPTVNIR